MSMAAVGLTQGSSPPAVYVLLLQLQPHTRVVLGFPPAAAEDHASACTPAAQSSQGHEEASHQLRVRSHHDMAHGTQVTAPYARMLLLCDSVSALPPFVACKLHW